MSDAPEGLTSEERALWDDGRRTGAVRDLLRTIARQRQQVADADAVMAELLDTERAAAWGREQQARAEKAEAALRSITQLSGPLSAAIDVARAALASGSGGAK